MLNKNCFVIYVLQDCLGSLLVFIAAISSLSACLADQSSPAFVGLSITYALVVSITYMYFSISLTFTLT